MKLFIFLLIFCSSFDYIDPCHILLYRQSAFLFDLENDLDVTTNEMETLEKRVKKLNDKLPERISMHCNSAPLPSNFKEILPLSESKFLYCEKLRKEFF